MVHIAPVCEQQDECGKVVLPGVCAVGVMCLSSSSFVFCPFVPEAILICDMTLGQIPGKVR